MLSPTKAFALTRAAGADHSASVRLLLVAAIASLVTWNLKPVRRRSLSPAR